MSTEQNKAVVRRFIEQTLSNMDVSQVNELLAPDYINHLVPGGREAFKQFFPMMHSAYPELKWHFTFERRMVEGDYVMVRTSMRVTNNGKEATGSGLAEFRIANGKIVEDWPIPEAAALNQKAGVDFPQG